MQLYDTYVNCDSKLWTCLMEKRCSGCLFHFWKTTVVPHSGHDSRHLTPIVPELEPQLRGFGSEHQIRGYLTATEEHEEGNDLQMPK